MKIKSDFITNSSSSSFIVVFDKQVTKFEDVEYLISNPTKAEQVLKDALNQTPKKIKANNIKLVSMVADEMNQGHVDGMDNTLSYHVYQKLFCEREGITETELYKNGGWIKSFYKEYEHMCIKTYSEKAIEFLNKHDGKYLYIFHYSSEFFDEMEHGGTFNKIPNITINKH